MRDIEPIDRAIINSLQGGFPLTARPFALAGAALGLDEDELVSRIKRLVASGVLSRFGPLWNAERLGGDVCLCAMAVPPDRLDKVIEQVNAHAEVAHNYERAHAFNIWFVISVDQPERIAEIVAAIEGETGLSVYPMPKLQEFFIGFRVEA
jgi:DNA-binding Lrp family transcriptional regulator